MRILLLSPWFPSPAFGGALIRVFETLRYLSGKHRVTLLAPISEPPKAADLAALTDLGTEVVTVPVSESRRAVAGRLARGLIRGKPFIQGLHYSVEMARRLHSLTALTTYDVIHVEHSFMAPYLASVSPHSPAKKVLSMHNIETLRFRRELNVGTWGLRRLALVGDHVLFGSWEERAVPQFNGVAAVSPLELAWVREHAPAAEVALVPNGVNIDYFRPAERAASSRTIVFPGLMNYPPNVDAVVWFCDAVLPLVAHRHPDVKFLIVGDKPPAKVKALAGRRGVEVTGRVPDVRPHLANSAAMVVPVRSGAGTRLKILEAMAMERPVVSTRQGAEGLEVTPGLNILVGDTAEEFADQVCAILSDPQLGYHLGREGRRLVEDAYDWQFCFRALDTLYERVTHIPAVRDLATCQGIAR